MSNNSSSKPGFFNALTNAVKGATSAVSNAVTGNSNNTRKNNTKNAVMPANKGFNTPTAPNQTGGVASVNFRYPANMQQPSEAVMKWATTAGMPAPPDMRGVARGGKRSTRRRSTKKHHTKRRVHKRKTHKSKSHKHGKRRN